MGDNDRVKTLLDELAEAKESGDKSGARKIRAKLRKAGYSLRAQNGGGDKKPTATPAAPEAEAEIPVKRKPAPEAAAAPAEAVTLILDFGPDEDVRTLYLAPGCTLTLTLR